MLSDTQRSREKLFLWPWCCSQLQQKTTKYISAQLSVTLFGRSICKNKQVTANMHCLGKALRLIQNLPVMTGMYWLSCTQLSFPGLYQQVNVEKISAELSAVGTAKTLREITLLSEIRIPTGISVWAQLTISEVRSSPHYWSVRWLSSKQGIKQDRL